MLACCAVKDIILRERSILSQKVSEGAAFQFCCEEN